MARFIFLTEKVIVVEAHAFSNTISDEPENFGFMTKKWSNIVTAYKKKV